MAKEFEQRYRVRDNDETDADFFNSRLLSIDGRLDKLEIRDEQTSARIAEVVEDARDRVDNAITPLVEQIFGLQEQGFLVIPVRETPPAAVEFSVGPQEIPTVTGSRADYFYPGAWVALQRTSTIDDWAIAKVSAFDRTLGILSVDITHVGGEEGPHDDVEIVATGGSTIAQILTLDEMDDRLALAQAWAEKPDGEDVAGVGTRSAKHHAGVASAAAGAAAGSAGAAAAAASAANTKAGEAADSAALAAMWAAEDEDTEVEGGLFSALHYAAKAEASAEAAALFDPSSFYTKTQIDSTLAGYYTASQTDTAIAAAVANLLDTAPGALDTLNELAAALGDDPNFAATMAAALAGKLSTSAIGSTVQGYDANTAKTNQAQTWTGAQTFGQVAGVANAVPALQINCALGNEFTKTISSNSTFSVTNVPSSRSYDLRLLLTYNGGTITWFSGIEWIGDTAPTLTSGKVYEIILTTQNGGSTWRAAYGEYDD